MYTFEEEACKIVAAAHNGQTYGDKPYFSHCVRVVENLINMGYTQDEYICTGWLHDVIEDTQYITLREIEKRFEKEIRDAVDAISRRKWYFPIDDSNINIDKEAKDEYLARVAANKIASVVKHADMCDNLLMTRSTTSPEHKQKLWKKYINAIQYLSERK
jgi:(p)ppGpp synthase/HD superfamily hydrolase